MNREYIWNWTIGGFNTCNATNRDQALRIAEQMGAAVPCKLIVDEKTCHAAAPGEAEAERQRYARMFD